MAQDWAKPRLHAAVMVAPAYGVQIPCWKILKHVLHALPTCGVAWLVKMIRGGKHYQMQIKYEAQRKYWTHQYPFKCVAVAMEFFYEIEYNVNYNNITTPVLVLASRKDTIVSFAATKERLTKMVNAKTQIKDMTHANGQHVIVGNIFNSEATDADALAATLQFCRACRT